MISKEPAAQEASAMTNQGMNHLPTKLNTENQKAVRARRLHLVPRTILIISLVAIVVRHILRMLNRAMVIATRNPRAVNRSHIPTGNRVMEKVTVLTRAVMANPTVINDRHPMEDTTRVLSNT